MWVIAVYHQVSLFSLKPSDATSTGGRSLLVPTPFSVKMALLDVALRLYGENEGSILFPLIRDLTIALSPPPQIVVNNCFVRIHKPRRSKGGAGGKEGDEGEDDGGGDGPFIRSVAFREYVQYNGPLGIALEVVDQQDADALASLMVQVTYFGKRGSLFQINSQPLVVEKLPVRQGYQHINRQVPEETRDSRSVLQVLDDCDSKLTFAKANIYSGAALSSGKDRVSISVTLPYQLTRSSRGFTLYERITP